MVIVIRMTRIIPPAFSASVTPPSQWDKIPRNERKVEI